MPSQHTIYLVVPVDVRQQEHFLCASPGAICYNTQVSPDCQIVTCFASSSVGYLLAE